jgi:hypothetical protein
VFLKWRLVLERMDIDAYEANASGLLALKCGGCVPAPSLPACASTLTSARAASCHVQHSLLPPPAADRSATIRESAELLGVTESVVIAAVDE